MILINAPDSVLKFNEELAKWLRECVDSYGFYLGRISYEFLNDQEIEAANLKFLNHAYPTDIISFDYSSSKAIKGEMLLGIDTIAENAKELKVNLSEELHRVMVHGLLHFIGFNDANAEEKERMRKEEDKCLLLRPKILKNSILD